jgi:hypothetical protein
MGAVHDLHLADGVSQLVGQVSHGRQISILGR